MAAPRECKSEGADRPAACSRFFVCAGSVQLTQAWRLPLTVLNVSLKLIYLLQHTDFIIIVIIIVTIIVVFIIAFISDFVMSAGLFCKWTQISMYVCM